MANGSYGSTAKANFLARNGWVEQMPESGLRRDATFSHPEHDQENLPIDAAIQYHTREITPKGKDLKEDPNPSGPNYRLSTPKD